MSLESVKEHFRALGMEDHILSMEQSTATVQLAAEALGVIPARIAKTLSFQREGGCILIVTAGDAKIDNAKFKAQFHQKAKMLSPDQVLEWTGHPVGGVCPFGLKSDQCKVYTDLSLQRFSTIYPACGTPNTAIELTCDQLFEFSGSLGWIDVCKGWMEEG